MGDSVRDEIMIDAPPTAVMEVLLAIEDYPSWANDLKEAVVLGRDAEGRVTAARFRAAGFGGGTWYTLAYDHGEEGRLAWVLTEGDITRKLDGSYELTGIGDDRTRVVYELEAELIVPVLGLIKRRTAHKIIQTALTDLKARVEGGGSRP